MYRVVITGAESTGKTTLAEQLAVHFEALFLENLFVIMSNRLIAQSVQRI